MLEEFSSSNILLVGQGQLLLETKKSLFFLKKHVLSSNEEIMLVGPLKRN